MVPIGSNSKYVSNDPKLLLGMPAVIFLFIIVALLIINGAYLYAVAIIFIFILILATILFIFIKKGKIQKNKLIRSFTILLFSLFILFGVALVVSGIGSFSPSIAQYLNFIDGVYGSSSFPIIFILIGVFLIIIAEIIRRKAHLTKQELFASPKTNNSQEKPNTPS